MGIVNRILSMDDLVDYLKRSERIMIVVGAGLSQPSGLPTFRENPEFWGDSIERVASASYFKEHPVAVWEKYESFRMLTLSARANGGHAALVQLLEAKPKSICITQNIDELLETAGVDVRHQIFPIHGSVYKIKCSREGC